MSYTSPIQFTNQGGNLTVDTVTDPNGAPASVLDIDLGFEVSGSVTLPNSLTGTGQVCLYAAEAGGNVNKQIKCTSFKVTRPQPPTEPQTVTYPWILKIGSGDFPDPQADSSQVYNLVVVFVFDDQLTDIGGFVDLGKYMIN